MNLVFFVFVYPYWYENKISLTDVASTLGYEELEAVTVEDMTLEVCLLALTCWFIRVVI